METVKPIETTQTWGPFEDYQEITTPHGTFGVPGGQILHFEEGDVWDPKAGKTLRRMLPRYEKVHLDSARRRPNKMPRRKFELEGRAPYLANVAAPAPAVDDKMAELEAKIAAQQATIDKLLDQATEPDDKMAGLPEEPEQIATSPVATKPTEAPLEGPGSYIGPRGPARWYTVTDTDGTEIKVQGDEKLAAALDRIAEEVKTDG